MIMKFIATDVLDTKHKMVEKAAHQLQKPGFAIDPNYRSHVTYQAELENIIYKSWIYAGHVSRSGQGDYFLFDAGEDSIIICRDNRGEIRTIHNICRHRGARVRGKLVIDAASCAPITVGDTAMMAL